MADCQSLIHPFQNDPGTSQHQRVMNELLSGDAKIDGRTLADLLNYFSRFASQVNYYHSNLETSNWQTFFNKSLPFALASIIKNDAASIDEKLGFYSLLFNRSPSATGLQLSIHFVFYKVIRPFGRWSAQLKESGFSIETFLSKLIREKLQSPLKRFIGLMNAANKWYGVKRLDLNLFLNDDLWDLDLTDLYKTDESFLTDTIGETRRLVNLNQQIKEIFPSFLEAIRLLSQSPEADESLFQSLVPLKDSLRQKHSPHLALLFVFLKIFQQLINDLNGFTRKHLDFFYTDILKLKPRSEIGDKVHVLFELQTQLKKYGLEKGLLVKDGKDEKKQEILFELDSDIVVNKTQVADIRTLFVNNQVVKEQVYVEGVYMAPKADKADGVEKEFKDPGPKNFPTLGSKYSKFTEPEKKNSKEYPAARIGFILASPVLLLREGKRHVDISIACRLSENCNLENDTGGSQKDPCCDQQKQIKIDRTCNPSTEFLPNNQDLYDAVKDFLSHSYYVISEDLILQAIRNGLKEPLGEKMRNIFLLYHCEKKLCCDEKKYKPVVSVRKSRWKKFLNNPTLTPGDKAILNDLFREQSPLKVSFSGEKEWIEPQASATISMTDNAPPDTFTLNISSTVMTGQPAVTFYNKEALKEDYGTELPLVKIELNNVISLVLNKKLRRKLKLQHNQSECCLSIDPLSCESRISLYHFFRNYNIGADTKIDVTVCGLTQFLVKNEEGIPDLNSPFPPFGARPVITSNFYIGSHEILLKNWLECWININWKDRPDDLKEYYRGYENHLVPIVIADFENSNFKVSKSISNNNIWQDPSPAIKDVLFPAPGNSPTSSIICGSLNPKYDIHIKFDRGTYNSFVTVKRELFPQFVREFNVNSKNGFFRLSLSSKVDFQHKNYPFILGRQMTANGKLPKETVDGAVYYDTVPTNIKVLSTDDLLKKYEEAKIVADQVNRDVNDPTKVADLADNNTPNPISGPDSDSIRDILTRLDNPNPPVNDYNLVDSAAKIKELIDKGVSVLNSISHFGAIIPNPPWTPLIDTITLDYKATAKLNEIEMIHLYPYSDTYKHVEIEAGPSLFPVFCEEGNLFIGLRDLEPGSSLNILFQLAEATADSEVDQVSIRWYFLANNEWKILRTGFEITDDATSGLTTSGIVKFNLPGNISAGNTVMPKELFWIRASILTNSEAISQTIGIHTQAVLACFTNREENDKVRLSVPLPGGSIATLNVANASIKKISQPYDSFGGSISELDANYYVRVSELLRHKGRAIQKFDYERLVLDAFPEIFKAKCINHSFGLNAHQYAIDFPMAPGYVMLAVIPDLNKLKAGRSFEPKVPVSILEKIEKYLHARISPFVHLRVMNPHYERIHFCLKIRLNKGNDEKYYKEKLKMDLREFLAPWAVGINDKLDFGQQVHRSDIVGFLESRKYLDYIMDLVMAHETEKTLNKDEVTISPKTPRSVLIAGDIHVCISGDECIQSEEACRNPGIPIQDYCK